MCIVNNLLKTTNNIAENNFTGRCYSHLYNACFLCMYLWGMIRWQYIKLYSLILLTHPIDWSCSLYLIHRVLYFHVTDDLIYGNSGYLLVHIFVKDILECLSYKMFNTGILVECPTSMLIQNYLMSRYICEKLIKFSEWWYNLR